MVNGNDEIEYEENNSELLMENFCKRMEFDVKKLLDDKYYEQIHYSADYWIYVNECFSERGVE